MNTQKILLFCCLFCITTAFCQENLVYNGSFEEVAGNVPVGWRVAGNDAVKQRLMLDVGRDGKRCAKLECVEFNGDGPDYHVMLCQIGKVSVKKGQWYRISFYAKGEGIRGSAVNLGLSNTKVWSNVGLDEAFIVEKDWNKYEFVFQGRSDLPAEASRLQFWFKSEGVLWLDDVELVRVEEGRQWLPQITADGVKNLIPNSSFECGEAGWGSFTYGLSGWAGNLYKLYGKIDNSTAYQGKSSLKISSEDFPVFYFDYFEPVSQKVSRVYAANCGWFKVNQNDDLTLSAYMRAIDDGTKGELIINEANGRRQSKRVTINRDWERFEFSFKPSDKFFYIAVGLDATGKDSAIVWIDAVQLEYGNKSTAYQPRKEVESFVLTLSPNNISKNPENGIDAKIVVFNNSDKEQTLSGTLSVTDFFDEQVERRVVSMKVPSGKSIESVFKNITRSRLGFFRINYATENSSNSLRCAVIVPAVNKSDSPLGFNHAYPWDFLIELTHQAGLVWWRDWSAKWETIEPERGKIDFSIPDTQIKRVLNLNGQVEVLLPFPSTKWSTSAKPEEVEKEAGNDSYLKARLPLAFMPKNPEDFASHAATVVKHYSGMKPRAVSYYQILNEPIYTSYALPRKFGYSIDDYIKLLSLSYKKMKEANPECKVVGGLSANLESGLTRDFITRGGLNYVDVFDIHNYDPPRSAESFEDSFKSIYELMKSTGKVKPIWITEWGCYADDDPPVLPFVAGDSAMNRSRWRSERAASEHIVKYVAVSFAYGFRKIFFHAGTCGTINGSDAGGVLYEYGGTPRKMYPAVAVLCRLLGVPDESVGVIKKNGVSAYLFKNSEKYVAICWKDGQEKLNPGDIVQCYDVMGNRLNEAFINSSPIYLISDKLEAIRELLEK